MALMMFFQVETIGDAYMVVGGVPIPVSSHAERVANFALGMIMAAREVINPVTGGPIQVRRRNTETGSGRISLSAFTHVFSLRFTVFIPKKATLELSCDLQGVSKPSFRFSDLLGRRIFYLGARLGGDCFMHGRKENPAPPWRTGFQRPCPKSMPVSFRSAWA